MVIAISDLPQPEHMCLSLEREYIFKNNIELTARFCPLLEILGYRAVFHLSLPLLDPGELPSLPVSGVLSSGPPLSVSRH